MTKIAHFPKVTALPLDSGLVRSIAWRTLVNPGTVSERETQALAASVMLHLRGGGGLAALAFSDPATGPVRQDTGADLSSAN